MAAERQNIADVIHGPLNILIERTGSEVIHLKGIKPAVCKMDSIVTHETLELDDYGRTDDISFIEATMEIEFNAVNNTVNADINKANYILVNSVVGGANGHGRSFEVSGSIDQFKSEIVGSKSKITVIKRNVGLDAVDPIVVGDVA